MQFTEGSKNVLEEHVKSSLRKALNDFKRDTLKQSSDNILLRFKWQYFKDWQLLDFFGPGLDSMSPWHQRNKAKNKTNFGLDIGSILI